MELLSHSGSLLEGFQLSKARPAESQSSVFVSLEVD